MWLLRPVTVIMWSSTPDKTTVIYQNQGCDALLEDASVQVLKDYNILQLTSSPEIEQSLRLTNWMGRTWTGIFRGMIKSMCDLGSDPNHVTEKKGPPTVQSSKALTLHRPEVSNDWLKSNHWKELDRVPPKKKQ